MNILSFTVVATGIQFYSFDYDVAGIGISSPEVEYLFLPSSECFLLKLLCLEVGRQSRTASDIFAERPKNNAGMAVQVEFGSIFGTFSPPNIKN